MDELRLLLPEFPWEDAMRIGIPLLLLLLFVSPSPLPTMTMRDNILLALLLFNCVLDFISFNATCCIPAPLPIRLFCDNNPCCFCCNLILCNLFCCCLLIPALDKKISIALVFEARSVVSLLSISDAESATDAEDT